MPAEADPAYQAYLKALGFDDDIARSDTELQKTQANASAALTKPEIMAQGGEARENISDSFEDRGMFNSSERLRGLAGQRRSETYQLALIEKARADAVADLDMGLARELAGTNKTRLMAERDNAAYQKALADAAAAESGTPIIVAPGYTPAPAPWRRPTRTDLLP